MENNINNNINFTAKLNIRALQQNNPRWKNIAAEFERQTLKLQNDTIVLSNDNQLLIGKHYGPKVTTEASRLQELLLTPEATENLMKLSDTKIAKKLVQILKIFKKEEETGRTTYYLRDTIIKRKKDENLNIDKDLVHQTLDALKNKIKQDTADSFAADTILQNGVKKYWSFYAD